MINLPCNTVEEYKVPASVTQVQIHADSRSAGHQSDSMVTLEVQPGGTVRVVLGCNGSPDPRRSP